MESKSLLEAVERMEELKKECKTITLQLEIHKQQDILNNNNWKFDVLIAKVKLIEDLLDQLHNVIVKG